MNAVIRRTMQALALMGTSTLVALALAEVFLRLFPGAMSEEAQLNIHWRELINQKITSRPDPYVGFLYPAGYEGEIRRGKLHFAYKTDENGFRNPSPWPSRAEVVAVGDSLTFGYGVDDGQAWTALLAQHLLPNRLVNLGLIGSGPEQYVRIYERFGVPLAPRVLLFGLFPANDITDAVEFDRWLAAGKPDHYDVWRFFHGDVPDSRKGLRRVVESSYLVIYLREAWKLIRSPQKFKGKTLSFPDGGHLCFAPNIVARATRNAIPGHPDFQLVLEAIERTRRLTEEHDTHLLVLLFPSKEEVYLPIMDEPAPQAIQPFATALREKGINVLDLTASLQERARAGQRLFHELDGHPNAAGYDVIADTVLRHLEQNAGKYQLVN
jgi:lysophospholipase L1-like esterase